MADLKNKILGLASATLFCTGMAYGQASCTTSNALTNLVRAEGTTELVGTFTIACPSAAAITAAGLANIQLFVNPALPVTSKVLSTSTGATEAIASVNGDTTTQYNGTVSGSTINFGGVAIAATVAGPVANLACPTASCYYFTFNNIRVNATSLSVGSGTPPSITISAFISGSAANLQPSAVSGITVGFAQNGLGATALFKNASNPTSTTLNSFVVCNAYKPGAPGSVDTSTLALVQVKENFASAFKVANDPTNPQGQEASQVLTTLASNAVAAGTRIAVNFANVPANVTLYVPVGPLTSSNSADVARIQLTGAAAGAAFAPVTPTTSSSTLGALSGTVAPVTISGGAGTATYEITLEDIANLDAFQIPVYVVSTANSVAGSSTPITISVSLAPVGSTAIPNFAVGASTTTLTGPKFSLCTTSLMFPFVTNQLGFDTGLAISNTSTDPFGAAGATPQSGTCTLNFYGNGAPTPNNVTTANIPSGTSTSFTLSSVAAGFQGYMIAQCSFQFAHAFAFVTNGVGANGGLSQGYLAGVILDVNQIGRPGGLGESLGN